MIIGHYTLISTKNLGQLNRFGSDDKVVNIENTGMTPKTLIIIGIVVFIVIVIIIIVIIIIIIANISFLVSILPVAWAIKAILKIIT